MALGTCPDDLTLQMLLLGRIQGPEADLLESHLAACANCGERLTSLQGDDTLVSNVRGQDLDVDLLHGDPTLARLAAQLRGLAPTAEPSLPADDPRGFLSPARCPEELGRLNGYRVLRVIGVGGMGLVLEAEDEVLARRVAIKVLRPHLAARETERRRFLREARATAALEHEHIVRILHVGESNGSPFLVMPLLHGESLEIRLRRVGHLPSDEVRRVGWEIALGLSAAHARGLVHRDVSPANVWLEEPTDHVRILDFGLARSLESDPDVSLPGVIVGTPHYMAPEQAAGETVDARADLFSLGCVLYRAAVGRLPFEGRNTLQVLQALAVHEPPAPHTQQSGVPLALSDLIQRLLAKDRNQRPQSATAVVELLAQEAGEGLSLLRRHFLWIVGASALTVGGGLTAFAVCDRTTTSATTTRSPRRVDDTPSAEVGETTDPLRRFEGHSGTVWAVAFAPDGRRAASAAGGETRDGHWRHGDATVRIWDVATGLSVLPPLTGPRDRYAAVAFSSDGREILGGCHENLAQVWDAQTGEVREPYVGEGRPFRWQVFGSEGRRAASAGSDKRLRFWDLERRQLLASWRIGEEEVLSTAFSRDDRWVAAAGGGTLTGPGQSLRIGKDFTIRLAEVATGRCYQLPGSRGFVWGLSFSPNHKQLLSVGADGLLRFWNIEDRQMSYALPGHGSVITACLFSRNGRYVLSGGGDGLILLWDIGTRSICHRYRLEESTTVRCLALAPDGRTFLSGDANGGVRLWAIPAWLRLVDD